MLSTTMGSLQLWKGYDLQWTREEGLSDLQAVQIVDLPEKSLIEGSGVGALVEALLKKLVTAGERVVSLSKVGFLPIRVGMPLTCRQSFFSGRFRSPQRRNGDLHLRQEADTKTGYSCSVP